MAASPPPPAASGAHQRGSSALSYAEDVKWLIRNHLVAFAEAFPSLHPKATLFTNNDGRAAHLLQANGTIPIHHATASYNLPTVIWLPEPSPRSLPLVFLSPTSDMVVKPNHPLVHRSGLVANAPYLRSWVFPSSNLRSELLEGEINELSRQVGRKSSQGSNELLEYLNTREPQNLKAHAASAILNFSENCTPEILTPYLNGIVGKLLVLLQNGKQMVQEGALTAFASVADSSQEQFNKYYDAVMPSLKAILMNATDKSNRMLRAKSMECISLVGMAVGKDKFREDAKQVMEVLMALQGSPMETDDPITSYMLQAWARLCNCLGQDFLPYMSVVMPPLLQSAQLKPDVTITSAESDDEIDSDDDSIETITLGDKRIGIRTSVLEEKATACNMLCCYADELRRGSSHGLIRSLRLVPLLKFYFHEVVGRAAVAAMPELLRSAKFVC